MTSTNKKYTEVTSPGEVLIVDKICECGGTMAYESLEIIYEDKPFVHKCLICNETERFDTKYPTAIFERK